MTPATHNQAALHQAFFELIQKPAENFEKLKELTIHIEEPHKAKGALMSPLMCCFQFDSESQEYTPEKVAILNNLLPKTEPLAEHENGKMEPWISRAASANFSKTNIAIPHKLWSKIDIGEHFIPYMNEMPKSSDFYTGLIKKSLNQKTNIPDLKHEINRLADQERNKFIEQVFDWDNTDLQSEIFKQLKNQGYDINTFETHRFFCNDDKGIELLKAEKILKYSQSIQITPLACTTIYGDVETFMSLIEMGANTDPDANQVVFEEGITWTLPKLLEYWTATKTYGADLISSAYQAHLAAGAAQQAMQDILSTAPRP